MFLTGLDQRSVDCLFIKSFIFVCVGSEDVSLSPLITVARRRKFVVKFKLNFIYTALLLLENTENKKKIVVK